MREVRGPRGKGGGGRGKGWPPVESAFVVYRDQEGRRIISRRETTADEEAAMVAIWREGKGGKGNMLHEEAMGSLSIYTFIHTFI